MGSQSQPKWSLAGTLILCSVAAVGAFVLLRNDTHDELLADAAGCYKAPANVHLPALQFSVDGKMQLGAVKTTGKIITDKQGPSLLPDKLVYLSYDRSRAIVKSDGGSPLMFSFGDDYRTVSVPSINGPFVTYVRSRC